MSVSWVCGRCAASLPGALLPDPDNVAARQPSRHRIVAALPLPGRPFRSLCRSFSRLPWPFFPARPPGGRKPFPDVVFYGKMPCAACRFPGCAGAARRLCRAPCFRILTTLPPASRRAIGLLLPCLCPGGLSGRFAVRSPVYPGRFFRHGPRAGASRSPMSFFTEKCPAVAAVQPFLLYL